MCAALIGWSTEPLKNSSLSGLIGACKNIHPFSSIEERRAGKNWTVFFESMEKYGEGRFNLGKD